jgi:2-amino-4-hydroxy-6-hydroxymethyldihydropteridine diphosphokinase
MRVQGANPKTDTVSVLIGIGSNIGNREKKIRSALAWLAAHPRIELRRHTEPMETEPWGYAEQPRFINAVAEILTDLDPHELLLELKQAEKALGRKKSSVKWGPREIDLDILLFGDLVLETGDLTIPHAHLTSRPFVLEQILELEPDGFHPRTGLPFGVLAVRGEDRQ